MSPLVYKDSTFTDPNLNQIHLGAQPEDWIQETVLHDINRDIGADFYRGVQSYDGETMLSISPKPWVNGDSLVASDDPITGKIVLALSPFFWGSVLSIIRSMFFFGCYFCKKVPKDQINFKKSIEKPHSSDTTEY